MSFYGNYNHKIDKKGRVSIPSKYRKVLEEGYASNKLFVTALDGALTLYPVAEWEKLESSRLSAVDMTTPEGRRKVRQFASNAEDVEVDAQGRIIISAKLQVKAGLDQGEVLIVGNLSSFEIWNPQRWEEYWETEPV